MSGLYRGHSKLAFEGQRHLGFGGHAHRAFPSGTINIAGIDNMTGEPATLVFRYMDLTEDSVKIDFGIVYGMPTEGDEITYVDFTLVPVVIEFEDMYENM